MPQFVDTPPVGFSLMYYSGKHGLRGYALTLAVHDKRSQETIKELLWQAYITTCRGVQPGGPRATTVKQAVASALEGDDGPQAA
jgi:hypothetical protein